MRLPANPAAAVNPDLPPALAARVGDEPVLATASGRRAAPLTTAFALALCLAIAGVCASLLGNLPSAPDLQTRLLLVALGVVVPIPFVVAAVVNARVLFGPPAHLAVTPTRVVVSRGTKAEDAPLATLTGEVAFSRDALFVGVGPGAGLGLARAASPRDLAGAIQDAAQAGSA